MNENTFHNNEEVEMAVQVRMWIKQPNLYVHFNDWAIASKCLELTLEK